MEQGSFVVQGKVTTFQGRFAVGGKTYKVRGVETVAPDGLSFSKKQELTVDGKTWMPYASSMFTKVSPERSKDRK